MKENVEKMIPKYQQIALEIANRIAEGGLPEGEHVFGRSSIAGSFGVSPETARRAFCMLADMEIVSPERGTGMRILSKKKAEQFREQFRERWDVSSIRDSIIASIERQKQEMDSLYKNLDRLISTTEHYRSTSPFSPYMVRITPNCRFIGKTIEEIRFWHFTGATLVGIKRGEQMLISPGPYAVLQLNDVIFFVTADSSDRRVREYLEGSN